MKKNSANKFCNKSPKDNFLKKSTCLIVALTEVKQVFYPNIGFLLYWEGGTDFLCCSRGDLPFVLNLETAYVICKVLEACSLAEIGRIRYLQGSNLTFFSTSKNLLVTIFSTSKTDFVLAIF